MLLGGRQGRARRHDGLDGVVVAAPLAQVPRADDGAAGGVAEDVVHAAEGGPAVDVHEARPEALDGEGGRVGVEVADQDDEVARLALGVHEVEEVVGRPLSAALAAGVHRERAVVVDEEEGLAGPLAFEPHPLRAALPVELRAHVLRHVLQPVVEQLPVLLVVRHADRVLPPQRRVVFQEAHRLEHLLQVLALLEAHDVERDLVAGVPDEPPGAVAGAALLAEEVPPEEVVGEDLDLHGRPGRRGPERRGRRRVAAEGRGVDVGSAGPGARAVGRAVDLRLPVRDRGGLGVEARVPVRVLLEADVPGPADLVPAPAPVRRHQVVAALALLRARRASGAPLAVVAHPEALDLEGAQGADAAGGVGVVALVVRTQGGELGGELGAALGLPGLGGACGEEQGPEGARDRGPLHGHGRSFARTQMGVAFA
mmetsp:Transcript_67757/g.146107  ORF Transcript_67757/g.146107 Transcript_67757/m.146107 type:complete len:426 (+) Transcript_67757:587-1864(+)